MEEIGIPNQELVDRIRNRIRESRRTYSPRRQKAELLLRNKKFMEERERLEIPFPEASGEGTSNIIWFELKQEWLNFIKRWNIDGLWDGCEESLWRHVKIDPEVIYRDPLTGKVEALTRGKIGEEVIYRIIKRDGSEVDTSIPHPEPRDPTAGKWPPSGTEDGFFIFIGIDAWTDLENLNSFIPIIKKLQKNVFGYLRRNTQNFGRDLCWFDLKKKFGLSLRKIALFWIEMCPEDIDLLAMKRARRNEKESLGYEDAKSLLKEIEEDPTMGVLRKNYEQERKNFIEEPVSSFRLTIRESIKRIEEYIERLTPF